MTNICYLNHHFMTIYETTKYIYKKLNIDIKTKLIERVKINERMIEIVV